MHSVTKLRMVDLNPHLICVLCGGYFIDATTIIECLHSFCRTCIVRYLESSKYCPICDVQVHKTRPLDNIRPDQSLQDLVYKLVPNLFEDEMRRRREFYREHPDGWRGKSLEERGEAVLEKDPQTWLEENISVCLELSLTGQPPEEDFSNPAGSQSGPADRRFLLCPASFTIDLLKKFIRMKFSLSDRFLIDVYHEECGCPLPGGFSLMDVANLYSWRRTAPLRLFYTIFEKPGKRMKTAARVTPPLLSLATETPAAAVPADTAMEVTPCTEKRDVIDVAEVHASPDVKADSSCCVSDVVSVSDNLAKDVAAPVLDRTSDQRDSIAKTEAKGTNTAPKSESLKRDSAGFDSAILVNGHNPPVPTRGAKSRVNGRAGPRGAKAFKASGKSKTKDRINNNVIMAKCTSVIMANGHSKDPYHFDDKTDVLELPEAVCCNLTPTLVK